VTRDPSADRNPLDRASFYVENLKCGAGPGRLERASKDELVAELEVLLRDAGVTQMTGQQLAGAIDYYGESLAANFGAPRLICLSAFVDGLMHGIALAAGLEGELRNPRGQ
jgi:F0F1-type ATP synthase membrane subunit c/vacuolar-type H+-ATPase subunit K